MPKQVKYVELGIPDAKSFFNQVALPNVQLFEQSPTTQFAISAAFVLWHLLEWHWHDLHPGTDEQPDAAFYQNLYAQCPELKYLHDVADAAKHRGLIRSSVAVEKLSLQVGRHGVGGYNMATGGYGVGTLAVGSGIPQIRIYFDDGSDPCWLGDVLKTVSEFWSRTL